MELTKPPGMTDEEFKAAQDKAAEAAASAPPMTPEEKAQLEESMRNNLRVIWREVDGQKRRATTFIPIDRESLGPDFLAALDESKMTAEVRGCEPTPTEDGRCADA